MDRKLKEETMETRLLVRRRIMDCLRIIPILAIAYSFLNAPVADAQFSETGVGRFNVPVEAPAFTLKELNGGELSSRELKGKVVVLNFFGTS